MSTMTEQRITSDQLKTFDKAIRDVVMEAVNEHGVSYRVIDGGHIRFYCGDRDVIPAKINHNSPAQHILRKLLPWLEENVPTWKNRNKVVDRDVVTALAEIVNTSPKPVTVEPVQEDGWEDIKYGFETNGEKVRCKSCGFEREGTAAVGLHLHHMKHVDPEGVKARGAKGNVGRKLNQDQRKIMRQEAVRVLAQQNGLDVVEKSAKVPDLRKKVEKLEKQVTDLIAERDELKARLDLIREGLRA